MLLPCGSSGLGGVSKSDEKYQMVATGIRHTVIVLFPLGKLKAENTTRTFVQSRSSMGEWSVGSTHTVLFTHTDRERDREDMCYLTPPLFVLFHSPQRAEPSHTKGSL